MAPAINISDARESNFMHHLFLMRHAKSSWKTPGQIDFDRPLNKRGKRVAPEMGEFLLSQNLVPDRILSSSARRARDTATYVANACRYTKAIELRDELYLPPPRTSLKVIADVDDDVRRLLLVSHNPGMEDLIQHFSGDYVTMPTAAIAHFAFDIESWEEIETGQSATLLNFWKPADFDL